MADVKFTIDRVIAVGRETAVAAWLGKSAEKKKSFYTDVNGGHQLDFIGNVIEQGYEDFTGTVAVYEDGACLYYRDSKNVESYRMKTYTDSIFHTTDEMLAYLRSTYADAIFEEVEKALPYQKSVKEHFQWEEREAGLGRMM